MRLGQKDIIETSEEVRQLLMELLTQILSLAPDQMPMYCQDYQMILARYAANKSHLSLI